VGEWRGRGEEQFKEGEAGTQHPEKSGPSWIGSRQYTHGEKIKGKLENLLRNA